MMDAATTHDDISADLAALDALRQSVQKNLALRPIRPPNPLNTKPPSRTETPPQLVPSSRHSLELPHGPLSPNTPASAYFTPIGIHDAFPGESPITRSSPHESRAIDAETLYGRLLSRRRPLLIDTRAPASHAAFQILHSINIAIPPVLLKRILSQKEHAFLSIASLRQFITTDASRASWDMLMRVDSDTWDGDVILYDDEPGCASARSLIPVIDPLLNGEGSVDWLEGGISFASRHPGLQTLVVSGDDAEIASARPIVGEGGSSSGPGGKGAGRSDYFVQTPYTTATPMMPGAMPKTAQGWKSDSGRDQWYGEERHPPSAASTPQQGVNYNIMDATPSPPPSHAALRPAIPKKASLGNLKKIDTLKTKKSKEKFNGLKLDLNIDSSIDNSKPPLPTTLGITTRRSYHPREDDDITAASPGPMRSADNVRARKSLDRLPKLQIGGQNQAATLAPPVPKARSRSPSPGRLNLKHSNFNGSKKPAGLVLDQGSSPPPPLTPRPADLPPSPSTAKPETSTFDGGYPPMSTVEVDVPPLPSGVGWREGGSSKFGRHHVTSSISSNASSSSMHEEDPLPEFLISMVLPGFLYLGPEPAEAEHVEEMKLLGIKRILNIAIECNPTDNGLNLQATFERYIKIPMRDTVEEDRVREGIKVACEVLDDARLHSAPVYVHCKAGKSRSVTAVIAYLIHANHWTLSRAYSYVLERRKGISPNIGFVSELMNFEEKELGGKSGGVQKSAGPNSSAVSPAVASVGNPLRRGAHVRDSLPPTFVHSASMGDAQQGPASVIDTAQLRMMGLGEEMETRDAGGRYRHARRAPVDEQTLQPMRRVSKAGLESIGFMGGESGNSSDSDEPGSSAIF